MAILIQIPATEIQIPDDSLIVNPKFLFYYSTTRRFNRLTTKRNFTQQTFLALKFTKVTVKRISLGQKTQKTK